MWQVRTGNRVHFWTDPWIPPDGARKPTPRPGINMEDRLIWVSAFIDPTRRSWRREELAIWCDDTSANLISQIYIPREGSLDELKWNPSKDGKFSIKCTYRALMPGFQMEQIAVHLALTDISCPLCLAPVESLHHFLLECAFTRAVWFGTSRGGLLHQAAHLSVHEWIEMWLSPPTDWPIEWDTWTEITFSLYWLSWKARCVWIFQNTISDSLRISRAINKIIAFETVFRNERISIKVPWGNKFGICTSCYFEIRRFYGMNHYGEYDAWKRTSAIATPFDFDQAQSVRPKGHCVVVQVTSKDPDDEFKPAGDKVQELSFKRHVFAFGESRALDIVNMVLGLKEMIHIWVEICINVDYTIDLLNVLEYRDNKIHTGWLDSRIAMRVRAERPSWYHVYCSKSN
ncbi:hypothetical protein GIB67_013705 [Kingdonia uniflora]|uniref:Reverse transcriptase zinc-binding domain-containing protein n=1 Tax=Kingdonia uniflora TaxID=39325 RepID=A0A7J7NQ07_9MAGN|nr:hypothetical protein GIB67_013705 [Kingdonia uniflora]